MATGGSSTNKEILQILSDIFQIPVFTIDCKDSAAIGAAIRAYRGYLCQETHQNVRMMIRVDDRFHQHTVCRPMERQNEYECTCERGMSPFIKHSIVKYASISYQIQS